MLGHSSAPSRAPAGATLRRGLRLLACRLPARTWAFVTPQAMNLVISALERRARPSTPRPNHGRVRRTSVTRNGCSGRTLRPINGRDRGRHARGLPPARCRRRSALYDCAHSLEARRDPSPAAPARVAEPDLQRVGCVDARGRVRTATADRRYSSLETCRTRSPARARCSSTSRPSASTTATCTNAKDAATDRQPPAVIGVEGAGTIADSGERVAWIAVPGSYAELRRLGAGQARLRSRRGSTRRRRGGVAPGNDRALPRVGLVSDRARGLGPRARGSGRRRVAPDPVGKAARRTCDRNDLDRAKGRARAWRRRRRGDRLRRFRRAREGAHGRRGRGGRLRRDRQDHISRRASPRCARTGG